MNKSRLIFILLIIQSIYSYGQSKKGLNFDIADFNKKKAIAEWLCDYDAIAWSTTDSVMKQDPLDVKRLGNEWFCYQTADKSWHAIYGSYDGNKYELVFHYLVDSINKVSRTCEPVDTLKLNSYSRALITANKQIKHLRDSVNISFNQYIKQNEDKTFTVWILPAFQVSNYAVYGGKFIYQIDQSGNKVLKDDSYYQGQFRAFKVDKPREIWLNYRELEKPTLGSVFFAWYYKSYFTYIKIDNKDYVTSTIKNDDGSYTWFSFEKSKKEHDE
jgi:hypothetical protein